MGSCLGHCLHKSDSGNVQRGNRNHNSESLIQEDSVEFFTLMEESDELPEENRNAPSFVSRIFSKMDKKFKKSKRTPVLELAEDLWNPIGESSYSRLNESSSRIPSEYSAGDISLQCLDASALLACGNPLRDKSATSASTPPSSLDLEWEHEELPSPAPWEILPEEDDDDDDLVELESSSQASQPLAQHPKCSTDLASSAWSQISTPDSLEWDPVQTPLQDSSELAVSDLDAETEQLLSEIERLTRTALRETGRELNR